VSSVTVPITSVKPEPVIVTSVAAPLLPRAGFTPVTVGSFTGGAVTSYAAGSSPAFSSGLVTRMPYVPGSIPDGTFASSCADETNLTSVQRVGGSVSISTFGM